ncbi:MAG TPA: PadR family transcriptional regulator [Solirubrobacteraceae bacterium]|jgi:DNA-binding PadR family transcriptional regulator
MATNRLLVLGAVRIFQPVHGYFVRRELLSWHAEEWAHLNPGSVYNAMRTLTKEGYLEAVGTEAQGGRPARTTYRLTPDGHGEFLRELRSMLWNIAPHAPDELHAAWSFAWALEREEVTAALEHRLEQIAGASRHIGFAIEDFKNDPSKPPHVVEHLRLVIARLEGEASWDRATIARLADGEYWFSGEPDPPFAGAGG